MSDVWYWRAAAVAAPGCALGAGLAIALAGAALGRSPIWPDQDLTLSEAVVTRAEADLVRLLRTGADPNAPYDVRPGLLESRAVRVTPIEAAVRSHDAEMLERLLRHGASIDAAAWNRLRCLAVADEGLAELLERHRPAAAVRRCNDGAPPDAPR